MKHKFLGAISAIALLAACSHNPPANTGGAGGMANTSTGPSSGSVVPGSQEDLVANVGDRVFYELNSSTLTDAGQATLSKQADWLAKYPNVSVQIAGNCDDRRYRGVQPGTRPAPRERRDGFPQGQGRVVLAHQHDQLRQGPPDGPRRRRAGLVAEPQRDHLGQVRSRRLTLGLLHSCRGPRRRN